MLDRLHGPLGVLYPAGAACTLALLVAIGLLARARVVELESPLEAIARLAILRAYSVERRSHRPSVGR